MAGWLGHSRNHGGREEPLAEHLALVAKRAAVYARPWSGERPALVAGLLHDLGKYSALFQRRLKGLASGIDHWSTGAWAALRRYTWEGIPVALAIQGHHVGLQRGDSDSLRELAPRGLPTQHPLGLTLPEEPVDELLQRLADDRLDLPDPDAAAAPGLEPALASMLATRMLFSALTDADYLETEAHFEGDDKVPRRYRPEAPTLHPGRALERVLARVAGVARESRAAQTINDVRAELLAACLAAAEQKTGLFTLTAPTGSGKTLAMLAFALEHARRHGLSRIITVIPYLSIIEQTVKAYRKALGEDASEGYLLEHHSLAGTRNARSSPAADGTDNEDESTRRQRLLSENWDAPLVVTTSVQMLESLFANRPSACRKLHRVARSVILFDEVQTMPARLVVPTLGALSELCTRYGSTVVFATATQPAFGHLGAHVKRHSRTGWSPRELVAPAAHLFKRTRRVKVTWPDLDRPLQWNEVARELSERRSVLCIVNVKRHAVELARLLQGAVPGESLLHLSTSMCPLHREQTLDRARALLELKKPCILISTQCVEAGVDVDFPSVFRAFGPLDAIAQAAGRCNRNGSLLPSLGEVCVFLPVDESYPPGGGYRQAARVTGMMLKERGPAWMNTDDPELFQDYFQRLYDIMQPQDLNKELLKAIKVKDFAAVAASYRLIDQDAVNVVVPYDREAHRALREELRTKQTLTRDWIARARPLTVSLFRSEVEHTPNLEPVPLAKGGFSEEWYMSNRVEDYDPLLGYSPSSQFLI